MNDPAEMNQKEAFIFTKKAPENSKRSHKNVIKLKNFFTWYTPVGIFFL